MIGCFTESIQTTFRRVLARQILSHTAEERVTLHVLHYCFSSLWIHLDPAAAAAATCGCEVTQLRFRTLSVSHGFFGVFIFTLFFFECGFIQRLLQCHTLNVWYVPTLSSSSLTYCWLGRLEAHGIPFINRTWYISVFSVYVSQCSYENMIVLFVIINLPNEEPFTT